MMGGHPPSGLEHGRYLVPRLPVGDDNDSGSGGEPPRDSAAPQVPRVPFEGFRRSPAAPRAAMPGDRPRRTHPEEFPPWLA